MSKYENLDSEILKLIQMQEIYEQSELIDILTKRGIDIPQATLSRRLKKLNVAKVAGVYKIIDYDMPHVPVIVNMQVSDFGQVVLQTQPAFANALAIYLDKNYVSYSPKDNKEKLIMGTIAGDDTVLLIMKNKQKLNEVIKLLESDFPYLKAE